MTSAIVIDDDQDFLNSFCPLLELHDITIMGKGLDSKDAINLYSDLKPDIVFLDVIMPRNDGITALEMIKSINKEAKVIVITSGVTPDTHKRLVSLGVTDIIYKPINMKKVLKIIDQ